MERSGAEREIMKWSVGQMDGDNRSARIVGVLLVRVFNTLFIGAVRCGRSGKYPIV